MFPGAGAGPAPITPFPLTVQRIGDSTWGLGLAPEGVPCNGPGHSARRPPAVRTVPAGPDDGVVFAENGVDAGAPWVLMEIPDMLSICAWKRRIELVGLRRKGA